jgi:aryl-alcohol dehydrogenase-like predicted oxidoreductase
MKTALEGGMLGNLKQGRKSMKYRYLGKSGLKVSEISLGSWLTYGESVADKEAHACVRRAFDQGINFFDTANGYAKGKAEEVLGDALAGFPRDELVVGTKVFWDTKEGPNHLGLGRKHIIQSCEASLKRLKMDYVDLMQFHLFDDDVPLEESLWALHDLQSQGKILHGGVSNWQGSHVLEAAAVGRERNLRPLISNQPTYNLLNRDAEGDLENACLAKGLGWVVYSPLAQGVLTGKYKPGKKPAKGTRGSDKVRGKWMGPILKDQVLKRVQKMGTLAKKLKLEPGQLALAWVLQRPVVSSVIVGATTVKQLEQNIAASGVTLSDKVMSELDQLFPVPGSGA